MLGSPSIVAIRQDYDRVRTYDPYWDREIELKFNVAESVDPLSLLDDIERKLKADAFLPYRFDPFARRWEPSNYVFGVDIAGVRREVCVVVNVGDGWFFRMKRDVVEIPPAEGDLHAFILDREEKFELPETATLQAFLALMDRQVVEHGRPIEYLGCYRRHLRTIACASDSGHTYAINADVCVGPASKQRLQQVEVAAMWKREATRNFSKDELYADIARLGRSLISTYNGDRVVLEPTRLTKFEWFTGSSPSESG